MTAVKRGNLFHTTLTVRGKSHPWPFPTRATPKNAEGFRGCQAPHPAAADLIHSLLTLAGTVVLFLTGCEPVSSGRIQGAAGGGVKVRLKIATCQPTNLPGLGDAILGVAERVAAMTAGRIELTVHEPAALVPPLEVLDAVATGTIDGGFGPAGFWAGKMPAAPLFSAVPFGPEAGEYVAWMTHGGGLEL